MINYEILKIDLFSHEMQIKYSQEGKEDFYTWLYFGDAPNVNEEFLHGQAKKAAEVAQTEWHYKEIREEETEKLTMEMSTMTGTAKPFVVDPMPEYNDFTHTVRDVLVEEEDCVRKTWELIELTAQQKESAIRIRRNALLEECDVECLVDRNPSEELLAYRQGLRDITAQPGFPTDVVWPIKPSEG